MGSSKKVTVSYWYKLIAWLGLSKGPLDAVLEIRGGDRTAWSGRVTGNSIININKPDLYGGEKSEGGIVGQFEVMMGGADQPVNSYLRSQFGTAQSATRGKATIVLRAPKIGAGNPYPKPLHFKIERVLKGWDDDVCWYPAKARITLSGTAPVRVKHLDVGFSGYVGLYTYKETVSGISAASIAQISENESPYINAPRRVTLEYYSGGVKQATIWDSGWIGDTTYQRDLDAAVASSGMTQYAGTIVGSSYVTSEPIDLNYDEVTIRYIGLVTQDKLTKVNLDFYSSDDRVFGMNAAHIIYDSITSRSENGGMGEPKSRISDTSFRAAADRLYNEGFGLCTTWKGGESAEEFQQRICTVIGGVLSQDRTDGLYHLDLLRDTDDITTIPTLTDDDILSWQADPTDLSSAINQLQVRWANQSTREDAITAPVHSLAGIEIAGGVIPDIRTYYEIASATLADRVAARDLRAACSPTWRYTITVNRRGTRVTRPGQYLRLLCPKRGHADVVCVVGDISYGSLQSGQMNLTLVQNVFSLPSSSYTNPQDSLGPDPNADPEPSPNQRALEAPYLELVTALDSGELAALDSDSGYLQMAVQAPSVGTNYEIATAAAGEEFQTYGNGDWTPVATLSSAAERLDTDFTISTSSLLDRVEVGTWAAWGEEIVRVDQVSPTLILGRGVGDTVPQLHAAGEIIYFTGDWAGSDQREYVNGETVRAKALTRVAAGQLALANAPESTLLMRQRQYRPYPPGGLTINGLYWPSDYLTSPVVLQWYSRNRLTQADQLLDWLDASVATEAGVTYRVRVVDANGNTVVNQGGITDLTYTIPDAIVQTLPDGLTTITTTSERDGVECWQPVVMAVRILRDDQPMPTTTAISTEQHDYIATESYNVLIQE